MRVEMELGGGKNEMYTTTLKIKITRSLKYTVNNLENGKIKISHNNSKNLLMKSVDANFLGVGTTGAPGSINALRRWCHCPK